MWVPGLVSYHVISRSARGTHLAVVAEGHTLDLPDFQLCQLNHNSQRAYRAGNCATAAYPVGALRPDRRGWRRREPAWHGALPAFAAAHTHRPRVGLYPGRVRVALASLWLHHDATAVGSRLRGHRSLRLDPCYLHGQLSLRCRTRCPARPREWRLSRDLVQRPHHRLLRTRAEPGASGRFAYRGHRVEWPGSDNRISVSVSAHAASDITTRVNPTMLRLILRCGASLP